MKYTNEIAERMAADYAAKIPVETIAAGLSVPKRSVIAKLSSMGVYEKKGYRNKRDEIPVKKSEYIEKIAKLLNMDLELCESLEKSNKIMLETIQHKLEELETLKQSKA